MEETRKQFIQGVLEDKEYGDIMYQVINKLANAWTEGNQEKELTDILGLNEEETRLMDKLLYDNDGEIFAIAR